MSISNTEREYLRDLAKKVNHISQVPVWTEKRELWTKKNALKKTRPLVLCELPEEVWPEIIPVDSMQIEDPFYRRFEWYFRKLIYRWENIKDDEIIHSTIYIPIAYQFSDWIEGRVRPYSGDGKKAEAFHPSIIEYSDLKKLKKPRLEYIDNDATLKNVQLAEEAFGDILTIQKGRPYSSDTDNQATGWGVSAIDVLCELRGLENLFYDMVLEPSFVHDAMELITQGLVEYLDTLEAERLLTLNNNEFVENSNTPLGSNGLSVSNELPQPDFDGIVRLKDLWGYAMAQEFSEVSPTMHQEFVLDYQKRIGNKFGFLSYGCCEPNDKKWANIMNAFLNLRELSVSHVANLEIAAEMIKDKYVFSWKPDCTIIRDFNRDRLLADMKKAFRITEECHLVVSLRDNLTLFGYPENVGKWIDVVYEAAEQYQ